MSMPSLPKLARAVHRKTSRQSIQSIIQSPASPSLHSAHNPIRSLSVITTRWQPQKQHHLPLSSRLFSSHNPRKAGLMPDSADPQPPQTEETPFDPQGATPLDEEQYAILSDRFLDELLEKTELAQETRDEIDVEYAAGVMNITLGQQGTWVINKQPPNRQIWLSSPVSGPKRYDWVVAGEAMHEKEGGGEGHWLYLRDGSTLAELLSKELGINVDPQGPVEEATKPSQDPVE